MRWTITGVASFEPRILDERSEARASELTVNKRLQLQDVVSLEQREVEAVAPDVAADATDERLVLPEDIYVRWLYYS